MIISALASYYDRKALADAGALPLYGTEPKPIPFIIVIDSQGEFVQIFNTVEDNRAKEYIVPQNCGRSVNIEANLLWDNIEYALGCAEGDGETNEKIKSRHQAFIDKLHKLPPNVASDPSIKNLLAFIENPKKLDNMRHDSGWANLVSKKSNNVSFAYQQDWLQTGKPICSDTDILEEILRHEEQQQTDNRLCIISGEQQPIERLHPTIKGVAGAKTTGANIVSFNIQPFCSYNKTQGDNSPIGKSVAFRYTAALNYLLRYDSKQKMLVAGTVMVYWSREKSDIEDSFSALFGYATADNPDDHTEKMTTLFNAVNTAANISESNPNDFYILGLSPNAARISIRSWHKTTVNDIARNIKRYFENTAIVAPANRDEKLTVYHILKNIAPLNDIKRLSPLLAGQFLQAITEGRPYPRALLQAAILRCRSVQEVNHERAAIIKACINTSLSSNEREITHMLDPTEKNPAYLLGRLFSVLERMQMQALPSIKATIKDRFFGAASATPMAVFPVLLKTNNHHSNQLTDAQKTYYEKLKGEIMSLMNADSSFPRQLTLEQQGRFALGYYHQRQIFYTKKQDKENTDE